MYRQRYFQTRRKSIVESRSLKRIASQQGRSSLRATNDTGDAKFITDVKLSEFTSLNTQVVFHCRVDSQIFIPPLISIAACYWIKQTQLRFYVTIRLISSSYLQTETTKIESFYLGSSAFLIHCPSSRIFNSFSAKSLGSFNYSIPEVRDRLIYQMCFLPEDPSVIKQSARKRSKSLFAKLYWIGEREKGGEERGR